MLRITRYFRVGSLELGDEELLELARTHAGIKEVLDEMRDQFQTLPGPNWWDWETRSCNDEFVCGSAKVVETMTVYRQFAYSWQIQYGLMFFIGYTVVLFPGLAFDMVAWNLSYDLVLPVSEGYHRVSWMCPFLPVLLASAASMGRYPSLSLSNSIKIVLVVFWGIGILWLAWGAMAVMNPELVEPLPLDT